MIPQRFTRSNTVMLAPESMKETCCDVHAYRGDGYVITAWRPTPEELVKLNLGEPLWLGVAGETMPPVFLTAIDPWVGEEVKEEA